MPAYDACMSEIKAVLDDLRSLSPDQIRQRLGDLDAEEKTLRQLLRLRLTAEAKIDTSAQGGEEVGR